MITQSPIQAFVFWVFFRISFLSRDPKITFLVVSTITRAWWLRNVSRQRWVEKSYRNRTRQKRGTGRPPQAAAEVSSARGGAGRWPRAPRNTAPPAGEKGESTDLAGGCGVATQSAQTEPAFRSPLHSGCRAIYPLPSETESDGQNPSSLSIEKRNVQARYGFGKQCFEGLGWF